MALGWQSGSGRAGHIHSLGHSVGSGARLDFESAGPCASLGNFGQAVLKFFYLQFQIHRIGMLVSIPQVTVRIK